LEKLGFPWILSPEISLFNGLRGIFRQKYFPHPSPLHETRANGTCDLGAGAQDYSWDKLNQISDSLQEIAIRTVAP
jgi:hypothetical protein